MTIKAFLRAGPHIIRAEVGYREAFGIIVHDADLTPNITLPASTVVLGVIPPELENAVHFWSIRDRYKISAVNFEETNKRTIGKYYFGSAVGEVEHLERDKTDQAIEVKGPNLDDCKKLLNLIKEGKIPVATPYVAKQVKSQVLSVKEALHRLIESVAIAFDSFRFRRAQ